MSDDIEEEKKKVHYSIVNTIYRMDGGKYSRTSVRFYDIYLGKKTYRIIFS
jgi:hypothetical protein